MSNDLKHKTITALFWSFVEKFGQQIMYLLTGMIVARIVSPSEYGLVGVLAVFTAFSTILTESGFTAALIRKQHVEEDDFSTVFVFNTVVSVALYLILFFCAPLIARFFDAPRLTVIARVLFLAVVFYSFGIIQHIQLTRRLAFKTLGKINLMALFLSSLGSVFLATSGYGVWALVMQTVGLAFFRTLFLWVYGQWRISFRFRFDVLRSFFGYSSRLILVSALNAIANNCYGLLIGKLYNKADVGYYNQGAKYEDIPAGIVMNTFRGVLFPVLSKVTDDHARTKRVLRRVMSALARVIFPVMFLLILIARPLIVLLISDIWLPSVPVFQILCLSGVFMPFAMLFGESFSAMGRSGLYLRYELVRKGLLFAAIFLFYQAGIEALAWVWVGYMGVSVLLSLFFMRFTLPYSFKEFAADTWLPFVISALLAFGLYRITPLFTNMYLLMGVQIVVMGTLYLAILFYFNDETLMEAVGLARKKFRERVSR